MAEEKLRGDFALLLLLFRELYIYNARKTVVNAEKLIKTKGQIELCDRLEKDINDRCLLSAVAVCWNIAYIAWKQAPPSGEERISIEPLEIQIVVESPSTSLMRTYKSRKPLDMTPNDRRFLRSLRIAAEEEKKE